MSLNHPTHRPRIFVSGLPVAEHRDADHLNLLLGNLEEHINAFRSALRLFDHCSALREAARLSPEGWFFHRDRNHDTWIFIAARAAAMEIFHVGVTIRSLRKRGGLCPSLAPHLDAKALKIAEQLFESRFRRATRIRHAISHASEMMETPDDFSFNFRTDGPLVWLVSGLSGRTLGFTHEGERMSVDISEATLTNLEDIAVRIFDAFRPMAVATFSMPPKTDQPPS